MAAAKRKRREDFKHFFHRQKAKQAGKLVVDSDPPEAELTLEIYHPDGTVFGTYDESNAKAPIEIEVIPAWYLITATHNLHNPLKKNVEVQPGQRVELNIKLEPHPPRVEVDAWGIFKAADMNISLDGESTTLQHDNLLLVKPGKHIVRFTNDDSSDVIIDFEASPGKVTRLAPDGYPSLSNWADSLDSRNLRWRVGAGIMTAANTSGDFSSGYPLTLETGLAFGSGDESFMCLDLLLSPDPFKMRLNTDFSIIGGRVLWITYINFSMGISIAVHPDDGIPVPAGPTARLGLHIDLARFVSLHFSAQTFFSPFSFIAGDEGPGDMLQFVFLGGLGFDFGSHEIPYEDLEHRPDATPEVAGPSY